MGHGKHPNFTDKLKQNSKKMNYDQNNNPNSYRVKSPIQTFRDLEVYQKTIQLSSEITNLPFLKNKISQQDAEQIQETTETIPRLIAEAYGDRYDSKELAHKKITKAITLITNIITKIDLLRARFSEDKETKEILDKILSKYQNQKRKVLNLRNAWDRVFNDKINKNEQ